MRHQPLLTSYIDYVGLTRPAAQWAFGDPNRSAEGCDTWLVAAQDPPGTGASPAQRTTGRTIGCPISRTLVKILDIADATNRGVAARTGC